MGSAHQHYIVEYTDGVPDPMLYYVYELVDPTTMIPFYVGKGRGDRMSRHISLRNCKRINESNPHKSRTINKIVSGGHKVLCRVVFSGTESDCFNHERQLIQTYGFRRCGGSLTNITFGGEGNTSSGKSVDQFNMFGEFITTYKNAKEAALINGWKNYSCICGCCRGRETSYMGYLWAYTGSMPALRQTVRPIYQWSTDGECIARFASASEAANSLGIDPSTVSACVSGKKHTYKGFIWSASSTFPGLAQSHKTRRVLNESNGVVYQSVTAAALSVHGGASNVSKSCNTGRPYNGVIFSYIDGE